MNPTDEVDDLLRRAGAQWRAGQPAPPEPNLDRITGEGAETAEATKAAKRWTARRLVPLAAAAGVVAVVSAALVIRPDDGAPTAVPTTATTSGSGSEPANQAQRRSLASGTDALLVRPGDKVEASGEIIAAPGSDPVFCAPRVRVDRGYPPGQEPAPTCPDHLSVRLLGKVNLSGAKTIQDVRVLNARVIGTWREDVAGSVSRAILVREQTPAPNPTPTPHRQPSCPAPVGGWKSRPSNLSSTPVTRFLEARKDQVTGPRLYYPAGTSRGAPVVIAIGVAHGDPKAFQREFEKVYAGNLCVHRVKLSRGDVDRIQTALTSVFDRTDLGVTSSYGNEDAVVVGALVLDQKLLAALAPIGLGNLRVDSSVRPVR